MDVLAEALTSVSLGGAVFARAELPGAWNMGFEPGPRAGFHILEQGTCWLKLLDPRPPLRLESGDLVLLPHGAGHNLASDLKVKPLPFAQVLERGHVTKGPYGMRLSLEGKGTPTVLLCGAYSFTRDVVHPLIAILPPLIHLRAQEGELPGPIMSVIRLLMAEYTQPSPGAVTITSRLLDVLFIHILRAWQEQQPEGGSGWLGAVRDPQVGRALALMHGEPHRDWTVESLALEVACSRATFARRFRELLGETPLGYLTRLRMNLAARLLRDSELPLSVVASRVGYSSEFAFNRSFHRVQGLPPGRYREQAREAKALEAGGGAATVDTPRLLA